MIIAKVLLSDIIIVQAVTHWYDYTWLQGTSF